MQTTARVVKTEGDFATIEVQRKSACEGCHKMTSGEGCGVCTLLGSNARFTARARNSVGAKEGDTVEVRSATGRVMLYAALVFLLPVAIALLLYAVSGRFFQDEGYRYAVLIGGFVLCFFGVWLYSRFVMTKRCDMEIVSICRTHLEKE